MTDYRAQRPAYSLNTELWTYQDIVEHLLDIYDVVDPRRDLRYVRFAKRAVLGAYRDLPSKHRWSAYEDRRIFSTTASQDDGTISYVHTGGMYERLVTIAGATVDANIRFSRIIINNVHYPIDEYKGATTFTLPEGQNPGSDVAVGTPATIYRSDYPLPLDFRRMLGLYEAEGKEQIDIVPADEVHAHTVFFGSPSSPRMASIQAMKEYYGVMQLVFGPPPASESKYDMAYERYPRPLMTEKLATGTVSTVGTAVTCTSSVFETKHIGSIIRFSGNGNYEPTGRVGDLEGNDNPYAAQRVIQSLSSATQVVIDSALSADATAVRYTVSDPLDLEPTSMLSYFQRLCEEWFSRISNREDRHEKRAVAERELLEAMERDNWVRTAGGASAMEASPFHLRDWSTIGDEIVT